MTDRAVLTSHYDMGIYIYTNQKLEWLNFKIVIMWHRRARVHINFKEVHAALTPTFYNAVLQTDKLEISFVQRMASLE